MYLLDVSVGTSELYPTENDCMSRAELESVGRSVTVIAKFFLPLTLVFCKIVGLFGVA